jgi:hypothetical protein
MLSPCHPDTVGEDADPEARMLTVEHRRGEEGRYATFRAVGVCDGWLPSPGAVWLRRAGIDVLIAQHKLILRSHRRRVQRGPMFPPGDSRMVANKPTFREALLGLGRGGAADRAR